MSRVDIHSQTKQTIFSVYNYLKKLSNNKPNPEVANYFRQTQKITAEACGVSLSTVKRITKASNLLKPAIFNKKRVLQMPVLRLLFRVKCINQQDMQLA